MASTGSGGSSRTRQSSFAFRLINPELFIKPNKVVMVSGTAAIIGCVLFLGYMNLTGGDKGTVSTSVQNGKFVKSKWD